MSGGRNSGPGRIRIIGGKLRNSRLDVPEVAGLRPTAERVRETLFNWLAPVIDGASCLDLCAGTGALGIEALSRGAGSVQFVERDPLVAQALRENLARLKQANGQVVTLGAAMYLHGAAQPRDLVFLDPPFALGLWSPFAQQLEQGGWCTANALIYVESPATEVLHLPSSWQLHREARAGEVRFALYRRQLPLS